MRKSLQLLGCLAILAAPMIALPAHAQTGSPMPPPADGGGAPPPPQAHMPPGGSGGGQGGEWRQEHEEMVQMRAEHDRLKTQCMNTKGQDRSECQAKMKALHDKMQATREKMHAMHEKREAEHHDGQGNKGQWKAKHEQGAPGSSPSGAPSGGTPSASPPAPPATEQP
jgi:hypothetical protein